MTNITDKIEGLPDDCPLLTLPIRYDAGGQYFLNADGRMFLQLRGWGYLTGAGALQLPDNEAAEIQDAIGEHIAKVLNEYPSLLADLERKTKALEMIAGTRQCLDNLMSDKDIAREALKKTA